VVTSAIPIVTMPPPEETPVLQTIPAVPQWTVIPQPDTGLLPKNYWLNRWNNDTLYRMTWSAEPRSNGANSPASEWPLRPDWLTYTNVSLS
jgi:hypothetical protein